MKKSFWDRGADLRTGHGGTLDPFATGVLAVCLGQATKVAGYLLADDKAYDAEVYFGIETDTFDRTGLITGMRPATFDEATLRATVAARLGEQEQIPPMFSAIKQGGARLYTLARRHEEVERVARKIRIDTYDVISFTPPRAVLRIACSKGTYIRSLVADLGTALGCGAHLSELRRTRSGILTIDQALTIDQIRTLPLAELAARMVPLPTVTGLPSITFPMDMVAQVQNGVQVKATVFGADHLERFQLIDEHGALHAIVHVDPVDRRVVYDRVFRP